MPHSQPTALQQTVCKFHLDPQYHILHWGSTILGDSTLSLIFISLIDQDNPGFSKLSWYIYPLTSCQSLITYNNRIRIVFVLCINCNWFKVLPSPSATIANLLHMPCYHYFKSGTYVWHIKLVPWNSHLHSECRSSLGRQYEMACACNIMKIDCLVYFRDYLII